MMANDHSTQSILSAFTGLKALVVGDICLDRWCYYDPALALPSAETGIPRTAVTQVVITPGAGGTVANNLKALGVGEVAVLGFVGRDGFAWELGAALTEREIVGHLVEDPSQQTFTYTKIINKETNVEDQPRLDFVVYRPTTPATEQQLLAKLDELAPRYDVIFVSDQSEIETGGVVTEPIRNLLTAIAEKDRSKIIWVDSRQRLELYRGLILKPNQKEAEEACARALNRFDLAALRELTASPLLMMTEGGKAVRLVDGAGERRFLTKQVENPVDICGAGDSFSAGAACCYAVTGNAERALQFGHQVASITIMKHGTGTASPEELLAAEASAQGTSAL